MRERAVHGWGMPLCQLGRGPWWTGWRLRAAASCEPDHGRQQGAEKGCTIWQTLHASGSDSAVVQVNAWAPGEGCVLPCSTSPLVPCCAPYAQHVPHLQSPEGQFAIGNGREARLGRVPHHDAGNDNYNAYASSPSQLQAAHPADTRDQASRWQNSRRDQMEVLKLLS